MKTSITEEMKFRQTVVEYAIKYNNNARAARRYKTSRQQVQRWRKKYDGTVQSLANQFRRLHKHSKQHTKKEINTQQISR
ncbi:helix-turn-helix domain-containing protein [Filifactor alocis]